MVKLLLSLFLFLNLSLGSLQAAEKYQVVAPNKITVTNGPTFCDNGDVVLKVDGQEPSATYKWFKDGNEISGATGNSYTATLSGSYHAIATNSGSTVQFDPVQVTINAKSVADFSFADDNKCSGTTISFLPSFTGVSQIDKYEWDFGDGQTSTSSNPNHIYNPVGCGVRKYIVTLKITDVNGCSATVSKSINVLEKPDLEIKDVDIFYPFSNCHNSPTATNSNYKLTIENVSVSSGCITSYSINWGDGLIQNGLTASSFPISHNYLNLGEYNLSVTALGRNGCISVKNYKVANQSNPAGGLATSGGTTNLCGPADVPFKISNWQNNSPGTTYHLKFGDGDEVIRTHPLNNTGEDEIITHTYITSSCPTPSFTAILNVVNACDVTPFTAGNIQINTKPVSSFTTNSGCANKNICFNNTVQTGSFSSSCSAATSYSWDFGDPTSSSNTSSLKDPCHVFSNPGVYTVTLTSSNPCGSSTSTGQICISAPLTPSFSLDNGSICTNSTVKATNTTPAASACDLNTYNWSVAYRASNCGSTSLWNFDIGSNSSLENPSFIFKNPGTYTLTQTITNSCGTFTSSKNVVVKAPPQVTITSNPGTCGPLSFTPSASVNNCGTSSVTYLWTFPGTSIPSSTAADPGIVTYTNPGTYQIRLQVTNECGTTEATKSFTIAPSVTASPIRDETYCPGQQSPRINFANTTNTTSVTYRWTNSNTQIGLAASGTGNLPAFATKNPTTAVISGTITVIPILNNCEGTPATFKISVNPSAPVANAGSDQQLCNQSSIKLAGNNPSPATGKWTLVSGPSNSTFDDDTKFDATLSNLQADQTYVFKWTIAGIAPCAATEDWVSITSRPAATIANAGPDAVLCDQTNSNNSYTLQGNALKSYESGEWTIVAQPSSSTAIFNNRNNPAAIISGLKPGTYTLKWRVSNSVCNSLTEDEVKLTVFAKPVAGSITGLNNVCLGANFILSYSGGTGKLVDWEESLDNITWNPLANSTNTLAVSNYTASKWFRVKIGSDEPSTCTTIIESTAKRVIADPLTVGGMANGSKTFCSGSNSGTLTLSGQVGNVVRWEYSADGTSYTQLLPSNTSTSLNYSNIPATRFYRAVVKSGDCNEANSSTVKITINPASPVANAGPDQYLCEQSAAILAGNNPNSAAGKWTIVSGPPGVSFTDETLYNSTVSGLIAGGEYEFKWTIFGTNPCPDTEDNVKIFNRPHVTVASAGTDQVICNRTNTTNNSAQLQGNTNASRPYETGEWSIVNQPPSSTATFTNKNSASTPVNGLLAGEYLLKWTTKNDACLAPSESTVKLTVYAKPVAGTLSASVSTVCKDLNSGTLSLSGYTGIISRWESAGAAGGPFTPIANSIDTYTFSNLTADTWYRVVVQSAGSASNNCPGSEDVTNAFKINVNPVSVGGTSAGAKTVCAGTNGGELTLSGYIGTVTGWERSPNGTFGWTAIPNSASSSYSFNNLAQTTFFRAVVKSGVCSTDYSSVTEIKVLATVDVANAGPAIYLCNLNGTVQLAANTPTNGVGEWQQISGPIVTFADKNDAKTSIAITQTGGYSFRWTISNGVCDPSTSVVKLHNYPALINTIQGANTYCYGQAVAILGAIPTGGNGSYDYTWESSTDQTSWATVAGATEVSLNFTADQTAYFRRKVASGPCEQVSDAVLINVQPAISNNLLNADQDICIGKPVAAILGSDPSGGDGNYTFTWQSSNDQSNWTAIPGVSTKDYQPVDITATTYYQRIVTTTLCNGPQRSTSNTVKITVNPDAKAEFSASTTSACIPFDLGSVIRVTPYADRNLSYEWFANGLSIGTGADFPGYTLSNDGDLVTIKLVAVSKYGCEPDTKEINFSTVKNVQALFSKDMVEGCGPLTVNLTNISSPLSGGSYSWDFGNGQTSTSEQPAPVIFQPHPLNRDTTYIITLRANTACAATIYTDSVKVRPKPLAVFSPDKTIGCSPLEVNFSNQSLGMPNTYTFDFGNGDKVVKTDNSPFSYTFLTSKTDTFTVKLYAQNECGIDSSSYDIIVYPNTITPELVINGSSSYGCAPLTVKFDNNSTGANSFLWDFNDGSTATSSVSPGSMQHTFTQPGTYIVKLTATNGCSTASTTETVVVYPQPTANFTVDKSQYCISDQVKFTNTSPDNYTFLWEFGDGITSNGINPEHAFATAGFFNVRLTATHTYPDGTNCSFTLVKKVEVLPQPIATFVSSASPLNCAPFTLTVYASQAQASGGVEWHFGDPDNSGYSAQGFTANYTYTKPGLYRVKAVAYNQSGCADSTIQIIRITASPKASFSTADTMICGPGRNISFVNTTSYDGAGAVGYKWYVNNTLASTVKDLNYNFSTPSNVILPYIFEVKLIALSTIGCPDTAIHHIQFNPLPKANFALQQNIGCAPYQAVINNSSTYADSFKWYLDDVLVSTERTPQDIFTASPSKTYRLKLVTTNIYGCKPDSIEKTLSTHPKPLASFTVNDSISCNGKLDLQTINTSNGAISYTWNFGDATPESNATSPSHTYSLPGRYLLRLIAYNGFCRDTSSIQIRISPVPKATFISNKTKGCTKEDITFQNLSENADTYLWDFGDGSYSGSKNPTHNFTYERSPYTIKLVAYGENGCSDTVVMVNHIQISRPPVADFEIAPDSVIRIPNYSFSFKNKSFDGAVSYHWDFGNGKTSTALNPEYTYTDTGSYNVRLIAYNLEGCPDTLNKTVKINGVPGFLFIPNAFEPAGDKQDLRTFKVRASGIREFSMKIFNKWGELIWESNLLDADGVPLESWDGNMNGEPAPQGVYIWDVYAKFIDGTEWKGMKYEVGTKRKTGPVHLIR